MRKFVSAAVFIALCVLLGVMVIHLAALKETDPTAYDRQAFTLFGVRVLSWFLIVVGYAPIKSLFEEDDLEQDWSRIDAGNISVGNYRGLELLGVSIAAAVLVTKV